MEQNDEDIPTVREIKHVIRENLQNRYSDPGLQDFLYKCTTLDPRFKTLHHLDPACQQKIYEDLVKEVQIQVCIDFTLMMMSKYP